MVACLHHDLALSEYSPRKVKQALVGNGNAEKEQVQHMVKVLLGVTGTVQADAADALAIAICHAHHRSTRNAYSAAVAKAGAR